MNAAICYRLTMPSAQLVYKRESGIYRFFLSRLEGIRLKILRLHLFTLAAVGQLSDFTSHTEIRLWRYILTCQDNTHTYSDSEADGNLGIAGIWHAWLILKRNHGKYTYKRAMFRSISKAEQLISSLWIFEKVHPRWRHPLFWLWQVYYPQSMLMDTWPFPQVVLGLDLRYDPRWWIHGGDTFILTLLGWHWYLPRMFHSWTSLSLARPRKAPSWPKRTMWLQCSSQCWL